MVKLTFNLPTIYIRQTLCQNTDAYIQAIELK